MIQNKVSVKLDNLFSSNADSLVIPRSTIGTISSGIKDDALKRLKIELPDKLPYRALGHLDVTHHTNLRENNRASVYYLLMATCVDNNTSNLDAIEQIANEIAAFTRQHPEIREVATPLIGTGAGRLDHIEVFELMTRIFMRESAEECRLQIYIPDENNYYKVKNIEERLLIELEDKHDLPDELTGDIKPLQDYLNIHPCYMVGASWKNNDQSERFFKDGIWENGYDEKFIGLVKKVPVGSLLVLKSTYATKQKLSYLRLKGAGFVTENIGDGKHLVVDWRVKNIGEDIADKGSYRSTISKIDVSATLKIVKSIKKLEAFVRNLFKEQNSEPIQRQAYRPISKIAGLIGDSDSGTDQLDIRRDVIAFAKIMASKSFQPPLAIALFGKWGSGKSFFMKKLIHQVERFSLSNNEDIYCRGIAQIHFNAWSYLDANLWASIVSRIFEKLHDYIRKDGSNDNDKDAIEAELKSKLLVVNEEVSLIDKQKSEVEAKIQILNDEKDKLKSNLEAKTQSIGKDSLKKLLQQVDNEFEVAKKIDNAIIENTSFIANREELEKIIPKEYLEHPDKAYEKAKSVLTFIRAFFDKKNIGWNIFWVGIIILLIIFVPVALVQVVPRLKSINIAIPSFQVIATISAIGLPMWKRFTVTYQNWSPVVAAFWKIKADYDKEIENALFVQQQREKEIKLEIENAQNQIGSLDQQLQISSKILNDLEFKIKHALATEALYGFIEKRCKSDDYRKHLGIVSIIRNDFDTLSKFFMGHQEEAKLFRDKFDKPLERIILYIDDLDRCPEERVVEVLEAVNLLMAFPLFVVVVGVDPRWIKNALIKRYQFQFAQVSDPHLKLEQIEASDYLEKIFQIPFHIKPATDQSVKGMIASLSQTKEVILTQPEVRTELIKSIPNVIESEEEVMDDETVEEIELTEKDQVKESEYLILTIKESQLLQDMSSIVGNNPRAIKRFVNIYQIVRAHEGFDYMKTEEDREFLVVMFLLALYNGHYRKLIGHFVKYMNGYGNDNKSLSSFIQDNVISNEDNVTTLKHELDVVLSDHKSYYILQNEVMATFKKHHEFIQRFTFDEV